MIWSNKRTDSNQEPCIKESQRPKSFEIAKSNKEMERERETGQTMYTRLQTICSPGIEEEEKSDLFLKSLEESIDSIPSFLVSRFKKNGKNRENDMSSSLIQLSHSFQGNTSFLSRILQLILNEDLPLPYILGLVFPNLTEWKRKERRKLQDQM